MKVFDCEVSINAISEWESGSSIPTIDKLKNLSQIYSRSIDEILDGEDFKEVNYTEKYFICNENWGINYDCNVDLYQLRNEQELLISSKFKELVLIRISRDFTRNEELEFKFLFENFFSLSTYAQKYYDIDINSDYLKLKDAINEMLVETRNMSEIEKYWEIQKLYCENNNIWFKFRLDVVDMKKIDILKKRFELLEDWQKDMLLCMFQTIEPYDPEPEKFGSNYYKYYEKENGIYNRDLYFKDGIYELITRGACINKAFLNITQKSHEKRRIIDRLEELYEMYLKPIEVCMKTNEKVEKYKIENNSKNRFLNKYYSMLRLCLDGTHLVGKENEDIDIIYDWFINSNNVSDEILFEICKSKGINTDQEEKYWKSDAEKISTIKNIFDKFKSEEKKINEGLKEIENLKYKLSNGERYYDVYKIETIGGNDEASIREYIHMWKSELTYSEFLKLRDQNSKNNLLNELYEISLDEIKEEYFKKEEFKDE